MHNATALLIPRFLSKNANVVFYLNKMFVNHESHFIPDFTCKQSICYCKAAIFLWANHFPHSVFFFTNMSASKIFNNTSWYISDRRIHDYRLLKAMDMLFINKIINEE